MCELPVPHLGLLQVRGFWEAFVCLQAGNWLKDFFSQNSHVSHSRIGNGSVYRVWGQPHLLVKKNKNKQKSIWFELPSINLTLWLEFSFGLQQNPKQYFHRHVHCWAGKTQQNNFFVIQLLSRVQPFATSKDCNSPGFPVHYHLWSLLKFMSIELVMLSNHLILCWPLLLLPSIFPSIRVFSSESALCIRWPKYWSFSFSISSSNE